jgi:LPXTG-site transpeptidase (sortase) family protein
MINKTKFIALIGLTLLIGGFGLLGYISRSQNTIVPVSQAAPAAKVVAVNPAVPLKQGQPVELLIPSLNIDLSVIPGYYNPISQTWTLTKTNAQFATLTPAPNNSEGDTLIYGHDIKAIFANLHNIPAGAQAIVKTSNQLTFYYQLSDVRTVQPDDQSVFQYQGKPILTLQTCTGLFYQYRQFFDFNLVQVS